MIKFRFEVKWIITFPEIPSKIWVVPPFGTERRKNQYQSIMKPLSSLRQRESRSIINEKCYTCLVGVLFLEISQHYSTVIPRRFVWFPGTFP